MNELPFTWRSLYFALPVEFEQVENLLRQFVTMTGSPRLVLETEGCHGRVAWRIGGLASALTAAGRLVEVAIPGSSLGPLQGERLPVAHAVKVVVRGHLDRMVALDRSELVARGLLDALSRARSGEYVRLQVVLGQRLHPVQPPFTAATRQGEGERRRRLADKVGEHGFGCAIRVGVSAPTEGRSRSLFGGVLAAFAAIEAPGQRVRLVRTSADRFNRAASPLLWPLRLNVADLLGLVGWPIGELPLPGVATAHPKPVRAVPSVARSGRVFGSNEVLGSSRPLALSVADSLRHTHLLGPTGTGKSTLIAQLAVQDMAAGRSVVVIDPKGDLVEDLLSRIPEQRRDDVVILDATDDAPVGLNPLVGLQAELAADGLVTVFRDLYADAWGPRTQDILHASLLTLAKRADASLVLVPLLLTNAGFRRSVVGRVVKADPMGLGSFWAWFESISDAERATVVAPLMNKLRPVLLRPGLRAMLGQTQPRFDLRETFTERRILLVNLAKGDLGTDSARLLGSVVVSLLWQRALERS